MYSCWLEIKQTGSSVISSIPPHIRGFLIVLKADPEADVCWFPIVLPVEIRNSSSFFRLQFLFF
jgi:hypothetical protein